MKIFNSCVSVKLKFKSYLLTITATGTSYTQAYLEKHMKEIHSVAIFFPEYKISRESTPIFPDYLFHRK